MSFRLNVWKFKVFSGSSILFQTFGPKKGMLNFPQLFLTFGKVIVIPIVIGTLGTVSRNAKSWHGKLDIPDIAGSTQLSTVLGTAHILRCCVSKLREVAET